MFTIKRGRYELIVDSELYTYSDREEFENLTESDLEIIFDVYIYAKNNLNKLVRDDGISWGLRNDISSSITNATGAIKIKYK